MAAQAAGGSSPHDRTWAMRGGSLSIPTKESHKDYEDSLAERTLEGASTGQAIQRVAGRALYGLGAAVGGVTAGAVGAAALAVTVPIGALASLGTWNAEHLSTAVETGVEAGAKVARGLRVNTSAQRAFKGTEVEKKYITTNPRAENYYRAAVGKDVLPYTPGEHTSMKAFFESQRERKYSGMRYAIDVASGRVIVERKDSEGNLTYDSYPVSDGSTLAAVTSESRLLQAARMIIRTLNDEKAGKAFEEHELVVFHIMAPEQQGGEGKLYMRGFKRENVDENGKWLPKKAMFSVDTSSKLNGAEIEVSDGLRKDICEIQGYTKKKEGALDDNGDVNNNKSAEKKREQMLADLKRAEDVRKSLSVDPKDLETLEAVREGLTDTSGDAARLAAAVRGLRDAPNAAELDKEELERVSRPVVGAAPAPAAARAPAQRSELASRVNSYFKIGRETKDESIDPINYDVFKMDMRSFLQTDGLNISDASRSALLQELQLFDPRVASKATFIRGFMHKIRSQIFANGAGDGGND